MEATEQSVATVPPLEPGDRLTRSEFERRYNAMPHLKKAELIDGVVYMTAAVRFRKHGKPHASIIAWLGAYSAATPGVELADNTTVRLDLDNEPQPDALLRIERDADGRSQISPDDYIEGPPELIVEIASSSAAYDLHDKRRVYRRSGVQEYLVWQIHDERIDWWHLQDDAYVSLAPDERGVLHSSIFPGLALDVPALLDDDLAQVLTRVQQTIDTDEHAAFVSRLQQASSA